MNHHIWVYNGEKKYKCGLCGKCFSRRDHLKKHTLGHNGSQDWVERHIMETDQDPPQMLHPKLQSQTKGEAIKIRLRLLHHFLTYSYLDRSHFSKATCSTDLYQGLATPSSTNYFTSIQWMTIQVVEVVRMLLVMSGLETNPGPVFRMFI